ncbi:MAG: hypothetical protein ACRC23_02090 [Aeromonas jandaei]
MNLNIDPIKHLFHKFGTVKIDEFKYPSSLGFYIKMQITHFGILVPFIEPSSFDERIITIRDMGQIGKALSYTTAYAGHKVYYSLFNAEKNVSSKIMEDKNVIAMLDECRRIAKNISTHCIGREWHFKIGVYLELTDRPIHEETISKYTLKGENND